MKELSDVLKFTPLEFETKNRVVVYERRLELKFTPLEFETFALMNTRKGRNS